MAESPPPYTPAPPQTNPYHAGYDQPGDNQQKYGQQPYPPPPTAQQPYPAPATAQHPYPAPATAHYPMGAFPPPPQPAVSTQVNVTQISSSPGPVVVGYTGPDYTCSAIMACLFCFWPLGIVAIYYAYTAQDDYRCGNMQEAERSQGRARLFIGLSVAFGIVIYAIAIVLGVIARKHIYY